MKKTKALSAFLIASCMQPMFSHVSFGDLRINDENELLFSSFHEIPGVPSYKSIFKAKLLDAKTEKGPELISCFPEKMEMIQNGKFLRIRNRFGEARYDLSKHTLAWTSLKEDIPSGYTYLPPVSISPDGKWELRVKRTKNTEGYLVFTDLNTSKEYIIAQKLPFDYKKVNVKWSYDSKYFLYPNNGNVYFASPDAIVKNIQIEENYRKIGEGTIKSVQWTSSGNIIYIKNDIIYRIRQNELYTRGLYAPLLGNGEIIAKLTTPFNASRNQFWASNDGKKIITATDNNIATLYSTAKSEDLGYMKTVCNFSLRTNSEITLSTDTFWTEKNNPVLCISTISEAEDKIRIHGIELGETIKEVFSGTDSIEPVISPDRNKVIFSNENTVCVYDLKKSKLKSINSNEKIQAATWTSNDTFVAGGTKTIIQYNMDGKSSFLYVSSADNFYWHEGKVMASIGNKNYEFNSEKNFWIPSKKHDAKSNPETKNGHFRVYEAPCENKDFLNTINVRTLSENAITYTVIKNSEKKSAPKKRLSLIFDALETSDGVAEILYTLNKFGIKSTFFINGEFIKRYPQKTRQISLSGNECASMFYSSSNLMNEEFIVDSNFIKRGLARNEDTFFNVTGRELSLKWHAPFYKANRMMKNAGKEAEYKYINASIDVNDSVSYEECLATEKKYRNANEIVDNLSVSLHDKMIIPINVGKGSGTRNDYLYEKLDLLISTILSLGYEIVPLDEICESLENGK